MWTPDPSKIITAQQKAELALAALEAQFSGVIQSHMDDTARSRRYDGIHAAISYRDDPNPQYAAEAQALFLWRSAVWTYSYAELDKVKTGLRGIPSLEDFIAELPHVVWPDHQ
jgi:hypothetical protein